MHFEDYSAPISYQKQMCIIFMVLETVEPLQQHVIRRQIQSSVIRKREVQHTLWSNVASAKVAPRLPPLFL
jgi:hypothetical protein